LECVLHPAFKKKEDFSCGGRKLLYICRTINDHHMKITQDKLSTKLLMRFIKKQNLVVMTDTWNHFGEVSVRIVSVGETDKWNFNSNAYARVINIEVTLKKEGHRYTEGSIPTKHSWRSSNRASYFKSRKWGASNGAQKLINNTIIPTFFKAACIPLPRHGDEIIGNITYKFID
jgi:hypothetical protein